MCKLCTSCPGERGSPQESTQTEAPRAQSPPPAGGSHPSRPSVGSHPRSDPSAPRTGPGGLVDGFCGLTLGWKFPETSLSLLTLSSVEAPISRVGVSWGGVGAGWSVQG